jgi:hypothetical protein
MSISRPLKADYVIVGAGAVGMAMADTLIAETGARVILVDRRTRPGGHWNDAYPFVRLHGPAATYGVDSTPLGHDAVDAVGLNRGHHVLPSGAAVCAYHDRVLREVLLPSGRLDWLPGHDVDDTGLATSRLDGRHVRLVATRRWIDATQADTEVPATHPPRFVVDGAICVTPTELAARPQPAPGHVIVGGGKTAIDTALWLLETGVEPDKITWIRPRDAWLLDRANVQPTPRFGMQALAASVAELEAARDATSPADLFARLESAGLLLRIDPRVMPTMYRCATVSRAELEALRSIRHVVRLGRVRALHAHRIVLEHGSIPTSPAHVHVHCSAGGLPRGGMQPIFQGPRIVAQYVRRCSPAFSAALIAHVEATVDGDDAKNALCRPVRVPREPLDWLRMYQETAGNQGAWARDAALQAWLKGSRLEAYVRAFTDAVQHGGAQGLALQARLAAARAPALARMAQLLHEADGLPTPGRAEHDGARARAPVEAA